MSLWTAFYWLGGAVLASSLVALTALIALRTVIKQRMKREILKGMREPAVPLCYKCGYDMRGQKFPRCPECGALLGFTISMDELPLTEAERKAMEDRCRGTPTSADPPS